MNCEFDLDDWSDSDVATTSTANLSPTKKRRVETNQDYIPLIFVEDSSSDGGICCEDDILCAGDLSPSMVTVRTNSTGYDSEDSDSAEVGKPHSSLLMRKLSAKCKSEPRRDAIIAFSGDQHPFVVTEKTGSETLGSINECNGFRFFQATEFGKALLELQDPVLKEAYANTTMVQQFQGSAFFALKLWESQKTKEKIFDLCLDGNGGWHNKHDKYRTITGQDGNHQWFYARYFVHKVAPIKKVIGYLVEGEASTTLSADFVLIHYYWSGPDGKPRLPVEFTVKSERRGKTVLEALKAAAKEPISGRALTPSVIFHQVMDSISPEDRLVNPYMAPKDRRQAKTAKQAAKRELFGADDLSFLLNHPNVDFQN